MDGIAVRAAETVGAAETTPVLLATTSTVVDTGDPMPAGYDAVVMREHVHHTPDGRAELRAAVPPYQHVRSIGEDISATELLLPEGHRLRPVDVAAVRRGRRDRAGGAPAAPGGDHPDRRRDPPGRQPTWPRARSPTPTR